MIELDLWLSGIEMHLHLEEQRSSHNYLMFLLLQTVIFVHKDVIATIKQ